MNEPNGAPSKPKPVDTGGSAFPTYEDRDGLTILDYFAIHATPSEIKFIIDRTKLLPWQARYMFAMEMLNTRKQVLSGELFVKAEEVKLDLGDNAAAQEGAKT